MLVLWRFACEIERKLSLPVKAGRHVRHDGPAKAGHYVLLLGVLLLAVQPLAFAQQPEQRPTTAGETQAARETPEPAEHAEGLLPVVARLVNFAILVGTLVYLLRSPAAAYMNDRGTQIRSDLVDAAEMKRTAAAQLEEIDRRMNALPRELEALRAQGAQEIAAEAARIRAAAAAERARLLEQARREIDQHVKIAERELVSHAADLAVGVAADRIRNTITDDDQKRLADRYVQQLRGGTGGQP